MNKKNNKNDKAIVSLLSPIEEINVDTVNKGGEVVLVPVAEQEQEQEGNNQDIVVYNNGITSIDFMLPDDERAILQENLNVYSDVEKMQNTLKVAQKNMQLRQKVKDLQMMEKYSDIIDLTQQKEAEMLKIVLEPEFFAALAAKNPESAFKALKHIGDFQKTNVQAREELAKRMTGRNSNKKFKIDLKFSNDSGEEYSLGVEG